MNNNKPPLTSSFQTSCMETSKTWRQARRTTLMTAVRLKMKQRKEQTTARRSREKTNHVKTNHCCIFVIVTVLPIYNKKQ